MTDRQPLHSVEAEEAMLGCLLNQADLLDTLDDLRPLPDSFVSFRNRNIFEAIVLLGSRKAVVDIVSVADTLDSKNLLGPSGGRMELVRLLDGVATTTNIKHYATILHKYRVYRNIRDANQRIANKIAEKPEPAALLDYAESQISIIAESAVPIQGVHISHGLADLYEQMDSPNQGGVPTGYDRIDNIIGGLRGSEMILIGARPSVGKTSLQTNILVNAAIHHETPVCFISLEMSQAAIQKRIISELTGIPVWQMQKDLLTSDKWDAITKAGSTLERSHLHISAPHRANMYDIRSIARRMKSKHGIKLLAIDYFQIIGAVNPRMGSYEKHTENSMLIMSLANELDLPVVVAAQLSREVEKRLDKWPQLSDLKETGGLEQDASIVMLLDRPAYNMKKALSDPNDPDHQTAREVTETGETRIIVAKNRNGRTGIANLFFHEQTTRFREDHAFNKLP